MPIVSLFAKAIARAAVMAAVLSLSAGSVAFAQTTAPASLVRVDDMLLPRTSGQSGLSGPAALIGTGIRPWPGGVIPVDFAATVSDAHRTAVFSACAIWSKRAAVTCIPRASQTPYLRVTEEPDGCYSNVGALTGSQPARMNLGSGCWPQKSVLHELGHVLGLQHEHQRADRDTYITIERAAVDAAYVDNFDVLQLTPPRGAYDFLSVMHYHDFAFAAVPLTRTMVPKPGFEWYAYSLGSSDFPSVGDAEAVQSIYGGGAPYWPARVRNLRIAGSQAGRLVIGWDAPAGTPSVAQYLVTVYAGPSWLESSMLASQAVPPTAREARFDLPSGHYFATVTGHATDGESARSTLLTFDVDERGTAVPHSPGTPHLSIATATGGHVSLTWEHGDGATPTMYTVYAGTHPGGTNLGSFPLGTLTSLSAVAPAGVTTYVRVVASNAVGGATSNEVSVYVPGTPSPKAPSLVVESSSTNPVTLQWSTSRDAPGTSYTLVAGTAPGGSDIGTFPMGVAHSIVANAPVGVPIYVRVLATDGQGTFASNEVRFQVPAPWAATPPSLMLPVVDGRAVQLAWLATDAESYTVMARSRFGGPIIAALPVGRAHSITIPDVPPGLYIVTIASTPGSAESNAVIVSVA